ncbi:MAG: hypothetical protein IID63_07600 [candidate division Zixibacteria bacterium]|nr:hypothetical protein [candidate division Zixibacteria bacterium]
MSINVLWKKLTKSSPFWFVVGAVVSWLISSQYYNISDASFRDTLLNSAVLEVSLIKQHEVYEPYFNQSKYIEAGRPFPRIINISFQEIYKSINIFGSGDTLLRKEFANIVVECMLEIDAFNVNIGLRNDFILKSPKSVKVFNKGTFNRYDEVVVPKLDEFIVFVEQNKKSLIDKPLVQRLFEAVF